MLIQHLVTLKSNLKVKCPNIPFLPLFKYVFFSILSLYIEGIQFHSRQIERSTTHFQPTTKSNFWIHSSNPIINFSSVKITIRVKNCVPLPWQKSFFYNFPFITEKFFFSFTLFQRIFNIACLILSYFLSRVSHFTF